MFAQEGPSQYSNPPTRKVVPLVLPLDDAARLSALGAYKLVGQSANAAKAADAALADLTLLAAHLCQTPIASITMVDDRRQWFVARIGDDVTEEPLEGGCCPVAVAQNAPLIVEDTLKDPRFSTSQTILDRNIRFYAGIPLVTSDGYSIGTLCVMDSVPRKLSDRQLEGLHALSRQTMRQLNLRLDIDRVERVTQVLTSVSCRVADQTGDDFFLTLVQRFTEILGVEYAYVALLNNGTLDCSDQLETVAVSYRGQMADNFSYRLANAPCHDAILSGTFCHYSRDIQQLYPNTPFIAEMGIESYAAMPILNKQCEPIGVLTIMDAKPMENEQPAGSLLTIFSSRIAAELEHQQHKSRQEALLASEREIRRQSELTDQMKNEFLAVISHELRSPLNPILGWAKLLRRGELSTDKVNNALTSIERNAQLQVKLIDDLLDISRILHGKLPLNRIPMGLSSVVEASLETVQLDAENKSISIELEDRLENERISGDAVRLQQAIVNLLNNAVKFTSEGGRIFVILSPDVDDAGSIHLQIRDTGRGISAEFLPNVFERFRQEDYSTARQFGGLGLGLAIAKQLIEMHQGTISVHSDGRDQGTTVDVRLPLL